jgi:MFS family permease
MAVFFALLLVYFVAVTHRTAMGVAGVEALDRFGTEAAGLAVLAVAQVAMYAAMQVPAGHLLDRLGPMKVMVAGSLFMAVGQALLAVTDNYSLALAARLVLGLGDAPIFISATRLIAAWFPPRRVPVLVQITATMGHVGQLATAIPVAWVLHQAGWTAAFGMLAVVGLVAAGVAALGIRMPRQDEISEPVQRQRMWASVRAATAVAGTRLGFWSHFLPPFSANVIALLWGVPFFITAQGLSAAQASGLLIILTLAAMVAGPVAGVLTGRHPLRRTWIVLASAIGTAAAWAVLLSFDTPRPLWQLAVFCAVVGAGGPISLVGIDFARTWNPSNRLGIATGFVNVGGFTSTIVGVLLVGIVLQVVSAPGSTEYTLDQYRLAFASLLLPWLVGVAGVLHSRKRTRADMAASGVVVPRMRDAVQRRRRVN